VSIQDVDDAIAAAMNLKKPGGALVADVIAGSPASDAGLEAGDIITTFDDRPVTSASDLRNAVASMSPGTTVDVVVDRSGQRKVVSVTLGEQPNAPVASAYGSTESDLLGFAVSDLSGTFAADHPGESGVMVTSVDPSSAAYEAGLRHGDVIHTVNREAVASMSDFHDVAGDLKHGDYVMLQVERSNATFFIAFRV
jgi:serine protease Do